MTDTTDVETAAESKGTDPIGTLLGLAGGLLVLVGVVAAAAMYGDMDNTLLGPDYTAVEKWRAVLAALTVSGLGLVAAAVGAVITRLGD